MDLLNIFYEASNTRSGINTLLYLSKTKDGRNIYGKEKDR